MISDEISAVPKFEGGSAKGLKSQKSFLIVPIDRKSKVIQHIQKSPRKSIRSGDMREFPFFNSEKGLFYPYISSKSR